MAGASLRQTQAGRSFSRIRWVGLGLAAAIAGMLAFLGALESTRTKDGDTLEHYVGHRISETVHELEAERGGLEAALLHATSGDTASLDQAERQLERFIRAGEMLAGEDPRTHLNGLAAYGDALMALGRFSEAHRSALNGGLERPEVNAILRDAMSIEAPLRALAVAEADHLRLLQRAEAAREELLEETTIYILAALVLMILSFIAYTMISLAKARRAEQALLASERRLLDFADIASDWYWETDANHQLVYISENLRAHGFDPNTRIGLNPVDFMRRVAANAPIVEKHIKDLEARRPFHELRYAQKAANGQLQYLSISGRPIFDSAGTFRGYRGSGRDVTKEIQSETALREALNTAEAANAAKTAFLANMSHELRTPLNAIIGFSEFLEILTVGKLDEKQRHYLRDIQASGRHLLSLISTILEISKLEAGKVDLNLTPVSLVDLIGDCVTMLGPKIGAIRIEVSGLDDLPILRGDHTKLRQVFINLLSNAIKFSHDGGLVEVRGSRESDRVAAIRVIDYGIGMRPSDIEIALRPFERISGGSATTREGIGLGLPIANSLVEMHGGTLEIASKPDQGTTVTVRLPLHGVLHEAVSPTLAATAQH